MVFKNFIYQILNIIMEILVCDVTKSSHLSNNLLNLIQFCNYWCVVVESFSAKFELEEIPYKYSISREALPRTLMKYIDLFWASILSGTREMALDI